MWRWADMSGTGSAEERKVSSLRELSPAIEPVRDLWPQIEARINAERSSAPAAQPRTVRARAVPPRWLAAAAGGGGVALGAWVGRTLLPARTAGSAGGSATCARRPCGAGGPAARAVWRVRERPRPPAWW